MYPPSSITSKHRKCKDIHTQHFSTTRGWWQSTIHPSSPSGRGWREQGGQPPRLWVRHACAPNAYKVFTGKRTQGRGRPPWRKREQLLVPVQKRRQKLRCGESSLSLSSSGVISENGRHLPRHSGRWGSGFHALQSPDLHRCAHIWISRIQSVFNFSFYWEWLRIKKLPGMNRLARMSKAGEGGAHRVG